MNARQTVCANPIIAHLSLFVIGRFDGFRFYEPYHLVAEPFRTAAGGRHFIVGAADFVADGFLCRLSFFRQIAAVLDFQFPIHSFPFLSVLLNDKFRSYHDFFGITTFDHKAGKLKEFLKKVGIIFCNRHQFLVFETDNISLKVGITFFSECVKSAILLKNEFSHFAFLNKSSIFNGLSKRLSRLFTAIASLEEFINGRKVTHIITTFFRGNGANTTFLIKSHDTKKVGITIFIKNY